MIDIGLQLFQRDDFERLINWIPSPEFLLQWAGPNFKFPLDNIQLEKYIQGSEGESPVRMIFRAVNLTTGSVVGHIELGSINRQNNSASVCRVLIGDPLSRGKGFGSQMMRKILEIGFNQLGLHRIDLVVFEFNEPALRCYERLGFVKEGLFRECRKIGEEYWSIYQMSMLESEWRSNRQHT